MTRREYRILGSLESTRDGEQVPLRGAKQRVLLAILLVNANRLVTTDALVDALWHDDAPSRPSTAIRGHVSGLRRALEDVRPFQVIVAEPAGYRLAVERERFDLFLFEALFQRGRRALEERRPQAAETVLSDALALFRGPPLAEFSHEGWARLQIGRLAELRLWCLEERIQAALDLGRHAEVVGELDALIGAHPLRERFRLQLMLALYRSGRQTEALAAYQDARRTLVGEFGIEPTRTLQELERSILLQDPALDLAAGALHRRSKGGRQALLFTDIEGSTRLVRRLGDGYGAVLVEHRRLLREAVETNAGRVVDSYGDGFFAVFTHTRDAVAAATAAQLALAGYPWPEHSHVRVRMGIHAGEPDVIGSGLVGLDVHRVARICAAAHGGQTLLSGEAVETLGDVRLGEIELRDLGEHSLRDVAQPQRLFQLVVSALPTEFPPPRVEPAPSAVSSPDRAILVVEQGDRAEGAFIDVAAALALSHAPHELIVARLVGLAGASTDEPEGPLARATAQLFELKVDLAQRGVAVRVAAFRSTSAGDDIARLAAEQAVDLLLLHRSAAELGGGGLDDDLTAVLTNAPCDVGVYVPREGGRRATAESAVLVPFGGGEHDWAALELAAWLASVSAAPLRLLGLEDDPRIGRRDASRLLASASLAVQRIVGVQTEPLLLAPGPEAVLRATEGGSFVVVGVPSDWRQRGLGRVRTELVRAGAAPTLLVRRGVRPGGLAPRGSQTRFTWSIADAGLVAGAPAA